MVAEKKAADDSIRCAIEHRMVRGEDAEWIVGNVVGERDIPEDPRLSAACTRLRAALSDFYAAVGDGEYYDVT